MGKVDTDGKAKKKAERLPTDSVNVGTRGFGVIPGGCQTMASLSPSSHQLLSNPSVISDLLGVVLVTCLMVDMTFWHLKDLG